MKHYSGFIKLHRTIIDWEWYTDVNTCKLFFHCLLKANYSKKKWQGITIEKDEFISSTERLAVETGLTVSKVRTALNKLESTGYLTLETNTKFTRIKVELGSLVLPELKNHNQVIEPVDKLKGNCLTSKSQTINKRLTTTKKNKQEELIKRKRIFKEQVFSKSNISKKVLNGFFEYWSELDTAKNVMRFEKETCWELEKRIKRWNLFENNKPKEESFIKNR